MASVKKNFIFNACYQILTIIIPIITTPYLSRVLGSEGMGIYSFAYSVAYFFVLFILLGLNNYGNRIIAESRDNKDELSKNFCNIYITQLFLGILLLLAYLLYCILFSNNKVVSFLLGFYVLSGIFDVNWFLYGLEDFKLVSIRNIFIKLFTTILIFGLVKTSHDINIYCFIMALSLFVSQIVVWPYVLKKVRFVKPTFIEVKKHIKPNLLLFSTTLAVSLFKVMDKIMLGIMSNESEVGFYESSEKVINIPIALVTALGTVMLPHMTNLIAQKKENNNLLRASVLFAMLMTSSLCFGIMAVAEEFVPMFYGDGYEKCVELFKVLLPSCLFLSFANVIRTQYLLPHKMDKEYVTSAFLGAGTNIVLNMILIPHLQSVGAAIGTLCAEGVVCFYQCFMVRTKIPILYYVRQSLPMLISAIIMYFSVQCVQLNVDSNIFELILKILIGATIYISTFAIQIYIFRTEYMDVITMINRKNKKMEV